MPAREPEQVEGQLVKAFRVGMQLRREMLAEGASRADADAAVANVLKANWPHLKPVSEWPYHERLPRCVKCDGYGWESRAIVDRLGSHTTEASVCACHAGDKYRAAPRQEHDAMAQLGKVQAKTKGFQRWGG